MGYLHPKWYGRTTRNAQIGVCTAMNLRIRFLSMFSKMFAVLVLASVAGAARASAGLLLEMPYGQLGAFNPTGHAALYFDHICAATPLRLRPCEPGELGVVISRYDGIGDVDWVAIPLVPYLYGVRDAEQVPATMDRETAHTLRESYRQQYLQEVAADTPAGVAPEGNWYELVGATYDRTIYDFQLKTTPEQDAALIAYLNDRPNVTRYEGAFRNCADFTRIILNRLYPHAVRRNYVADFGLTTPKSVARGLSHYGKTHPELDLQVYKVPQLPGSLPRSMAIQGVTGSLVTRYLVPMALVSPHVTAVVLVAYLGKGRFSMPRHAPVLDVAEMQRVASAQVLSARVDGQPAGDGGDAGAGTEAAEGLLAGPDWTDAGAVPFLPR